MQNKLPSEFSSTVDSIYHITVLFLSHTSVSLLLLPSSDPLHLLSKNISCISVLKWTAGRSTLTVNAIGLLSCLCLHGNGPAIVIMTSLCHYHPPPPLRTLSLPLLSCFSSFLPSSWRLYKRGGANATVYNTKIMSILPASLNMWFSLYEKIQYISILEYMDSSKHRLCHSCLIGQFKQCSASAICEFYIIG